MIGIQLILIFLTTHVRSFGTVDQLELAPIWSELDFNDDFFRIRFLPLSPDFQIELHTSCIVCKPLILLMTSEMIYNDVLLTVRDSTNTFKKYVELTRDPFDTLGNTVYTTGADVTLKYKDDRTMELYISEKFVID